MRPNFLYSAMLAASLSFASASFAETQQHTNHSTSMKETQHADLHIEQPWSRALPPTAQTGATFVSIHNMSGAGDRLIGAHAAIAETTELHNHIHADGLMKMVEVASIEIPAGERLELKPGSYHIMLIGLKQPLREGDLFPIRLDFEAAGSIELEAVVKGMSAGTAAEHMHH